VFDRTGSYGWAFIMAAVGLVLAAFFSMKLKLENPIQPAAAD
jgi:hypothetical protein